MKKLTAVNKLLLIALIFIVASQSSFGQVAYRKTGDMLRAVYDANFDGVIDGLVAKANLVGGNNWTGNQSINGALMLSGGIYSTSDDPTERYMYNAAGYHVKETASPSQTANMTIISPSAMPASNGQVRYFNVNGTSYFGNVSSGSGSSVAGNDTEIQVNINGSMGSDPKFRWDNTSKSLNIGNSTSGRGGISFGDANNNTAFKTGIIGADNATVNYLAAMPNNRPANNTRSIWYYMSNGTIVRNENGVNVTYDKVDGRFYDVTPFINNTIGNSKYYGTNSTGSTGYFDLPSGSGGGEVVYANVTEVNAGTETAKAINPDSLAGSRYGTKEFSIGATNATATLTTGTLRPYFRVPPAFSGMNLVTVFGRVNKVSSDGNVVVQIRRSRAGTVVDMLSTALSIDANEYDSSTAATAAVINTSNDDVQAGDVIYFHVTSTGTGTADWQFGCEFRMP